MKKTIYILFSAAVAAALLAGACAKEESEDSTEAARRRAEAWLSVYHPDATETDGGIWILSDTPGTGEEWDAEGKGFAYVHSTLRDLDGSISSTDVAEIARQTGSWSRAGYYGPTLWMVSLGGVYDGYAAALDGMRIGGKRTVFIPSWKAGGSAHGVLDLELCYQSDNVLDYQVDQLKAFSAAHLNNADSTYYNGEDGDRYGFYFRSLRAGTSTGSIPADTTVYIDYTGRRLDGTVFDTTVSDTAKVHGIYSSSKTYAPIPVYWSSTADGIRMTASKTTPITGFRWTLWNMHPGEKVISAFYSELGYSSSGSGSNIPSYCPLSFTIELVPAP